MLLTLDINRMAEPILGLDRGNDANFVGEIQNEPFPDNFNKKLNSFILELEGANQHFEDLMDSEAKRLLKDTSKIIEKFYVLEDNLNTNDCLKDKELKKKMSFLLKTLYKTESILHRIAYRNEVSEKTPDNVLKGISKMNLRTISKKNT